jgi:hypothetical protein
VFDLAHQTAAGGFLPRNQTFEKETGMSEKFNMVKAHLLEMGMPVVMEDTAEELVVVEDEEKGIKNLIIDCEDSILVLEQVIIPVPDDPGELYIRLLKMNRSLVHGAFAMDEDEKHILFRDTLCLENLDRNELEGSIDALGLAMAEHGVELLGYVKQS